MQMQTIFLDIMFDPWNILSLVFLRKDLFSMCAQGSFPDAPIYLFPVSLNPQVPGDKDRLAYPALACPRAAGRLHRKSPWPTSCSFAEAADWGCFPGKLSCAFERPLCPSLGGQDGPILVSCPRLAGHRSMELKQYMYEKGLNIVHY